MLAQCQVTISMLTYKLYCIQENEKNATGSAPKTFTFSARLRFVDLSCPYIALFLRPSSRALAVFISRNIRHVRSGEKIFSCIQKFYLEYECAVGRNTTERPVSICKFCRDEDLPLRPRFHELQCLCPTTHHAIGMDYHGLAMAV